MGKVLAAKQHKPDHAPPTPSGMQPVYTKEPTPARRKKPGRKNGHAGCRRPTPFQIHRRVVLRLQRCPTCATKVTACNDSRTRIVEDIPENINPVVTEYT